MRPTHSVSGKISNSRPTRVFPPLGQHQSGYMNHRGRTVKLVQANTQAVTPFLISTAPRGREIRSPLGVKQKTWSWYMSRRECLEHLFRRCRRAPADPPCRAASHRRRCPRRRRSRHMLAVAPMRGDAALGDVMHVLGADLDFDALLFRPDHRGVDGAVAVGLGRGDEILEALRHHLPVGVHDAERAVAILLVFDDDAEAENVGELLEIELLVLQLAPDRERPLGAAIDPGLDAMLGQLALDLVGDAPDAVAADACRGGRNRVTMELRASGSSSAKARSSSSSRMFCMPMRPASGA